MNNKSKPKWLTKEVEVLFLAVLKLHNEDEARKFFRDIFTIEEIKTFAERLKVAIMLDQKFAYTEIEKQTGMSSATIARINRWLKYGENGYRLVINRLRRH